MTRLIVQFWNRWTQHLQYFFARIYWGCVCCCRLKNSVASQCSYTYRRLGAAMASVIDIPHGGHPPPAVITSADRRGGDRKRNDSISSSADTVISTTSAARYKLPHTEGQIKYLHSVYVLLCILYRWTQEAAYLRYYMKYIMQSSIWNFMHSTIHSNAMVLITGLLFKCSECMALAICLDVDLSKDPFSDNGSNQTGHRKKINPACGFFSIFISECISLPATNFLVTNHKQVDSNILTSGTVLESEILSYSRRNV